MTSVSSLSGYSYSTSYKSSLDKNGDGVVSADELAAIKPSGTSLTGAQSTATGEEGASQALDKLSALISSLLLQMTGGESDAGASGEDDVFSSLDADGDGAVSAAEFATGKPDDVSDDQSATLFASLDTDGDGVLGAEEFAAMRPEGPPPPPPPAGAGEEGELDLTDLLERLQTVIETYLEDAGEDTAENAVLLTA